MQLKSILNRVHKIKSFVYETVRWVEGAEEPTIEIEVRRRANSRSECSICGCRCPGYDRLPERRFEFIPFWGDQGIFSLCAATSGMPFLWSKGGANALGDRKASAD